MHRNVRTADRRATTMSHASLRGKLQRASRRPRLAMATKAALAAAIAWTAVQPIGGVVDRYPYYAPFGAVVAVSTTVVSSARNSVQSVLAILLGAGVAVGLDLWLGKTVATVAAVVALGTLLGAWHRLGAMAAWVPMSGLFVLILGDAQPEQYILAYAGLTALGAAIGVAVNLAFPPLPLDAADEALDRLRDTLARQFEELAESLLAETPLGVSDWENRSQAVESAAATARETVHRAVEGQRANWRARRWREQAHRQYDAALPLEHMSFIVEDVTAILVHETGSREAVPWGTPLRPRVAHVLQAMAELLRSIDGSEPAWDEVATVDSALDRLVEEVRRAREETGDDLFGVGGLITTFRRARASILSGEE
jgi:uncharacterized membrane protein YgaE (UPF0421/DUF939 family)